MEKGCYSKTEKACPKLLDLIPKSERQSHVKRGEGGGDDDAEEKKLQLRLGPPGEEEEEGEYWCINGGRGGVKEEEDKSLFSLGYNQFLSCNEKNPTHVWLKQNQQQAGSSSFVQSCLPVMAKESSQSQPCGSKPVVDLQQQQQKKQVVAEKKAFLPPPPVNSTAVPNSSQKRTAPGPAVGWPPIRSFRKNLASSSSSNSTKPSGVELQNGNPNKKVAAIEEQRPESSNKGLLVKINMDGVPIGRKVDLKVYNSYEKLSSAVDELFRGLLAAQRDSFDGGILNKQEEERTITGVLDGSGEYTLVYEDNEGDRMLVGDVPWHMFVSTVKRLRVLKSSEVSAMNFGSSKQREDAIEAKKIEFCL